MKSSAAFHPPAAPLMVMENEISCFKRSQPWTFDLFPVGCLISLGSGPACLSLFSRGRVRLIVLPIYYAGFVCVSSAWPRLFEGSTRCRSVWLKGRSKHNDQFPRTRTKLSATLPLIGLAIMIFRKKIKHTTPGSNGASRPPKC